MKIKSLFTTLFSIFFILTASNSFAQITLKASHQFPGGKGDARDEMMNLLAKEVEKANVGVKIQVYPGQSLYKAMEQYKPLVEGQLDLVSLPLDYAAGFVPEFSITLMPGLVKNHEHAQRINVSPFMKDIKKMINDQGAIVLADAWFAGGFASKNKCITNPESAKGQVTRAAGPMFEEMLVGAGASISSMASSEVYQGLQTGVLNAVNTSSQSFVSFKLFEQVKCITPPGKYALWFMYQPLLMSKKSFDKLNPKQKEAIDDYLETCARVGKQPNKPYSGQFRLRLSPDLHARVAIAAESKGKSLNTLITDLIERAV